MVNIHEHGLFGRYTRERDIQTEREKTEREIEREGGKVKARDYYLVNIHDFVLFRRYTRKRERESE